MSATILWIMCVVIVVALAVWLATLGLAARRPCECQGRHGKAGRGRMAPAGFAVLEVRCSRGRG